MNNKVEVTDKVEVMEEDGTRIKFRLITESRNFVITIFRGKSIEINPEGQYYAENRLKGDIYGDTKKRFLTALDKAYYDGDAIINKYFDYALPTDRCLSEYNEVLVHFLTIHNNKNQSYLTEYLKKKQYRSKSGIELTNSHISNFLRKDLGIRQVPEYEKPNYKGYNWLAFS